MRPYRRGDDGGNQDGRPRTSKLDEVDPLLAMLKKRGHETLDDDEGPSELKIQQEDVK